MYAKTHRQVMVLFSYRSGDYIPLPISVSFVSQVQQDWKPPHFFDRCFESTESWDLVTCSFDLRVINWIPRRGTNSQSTQPGFVYLHSLKKAQFRINLLSITFLLFSTSSKHRQSKYIYVTFCSMFYLFSFIRVYINFYLTDSRTLGLWNSLVPSS